MAEWKCETCSLNGAEAIMNALETDGYEVHYVKVIETLAFGSIEGGENDEGSQLLGRFTQLQVFIAAVRKNEEETR